MATYRVGTSGYSYKQWKGGFYPADLSDKKMLEYYSGELDSVEINYTFYRFATVRLLEGWAARVGDDFTFTLKAPRRVTHDKRLAGDAIQLAKDFCANALHLGDKLGAVLVQLPPFLKVDLPRLEEFLSEVATGPRIVLEFRHDSWLCDEVFACLERFHVALCVADKDDDSELLIPTTAKFGYFRLRRPSYDADGLAKVADRIAAAASDWDEVFVYFKHEDEGPSYALDLRERLVR